jgi:L-ascorbate metabolism protein UlaG (beta-lactamase superfamily)
MRYLLSDAVKLRLVYDDRTPLGSAVTGRCDTTVRALAENVVSARAALGLAGAVARSRSLLAETGFAALQVAPGQLRSEFLYPRPDAVRPVALALDGAAGQRLGEIALPGGLVGELAGWLGDWARGAPAPAGGPARALWQALAELGGLTTAAAGDVTAAIPAGADLTFVGHATAALHGSAGTLLFDPFFLPPAARYPASYQPLTLRQLGPLAAVFVSHSHPDHFDPGDLLRVGADTPIHVPRVARESLLSIDMASRLRELGFRRVVELGWWDSARIGAATVTALPFHGEQPTTSERLHPELRNQGNLYAVEMDGRRYALTVDAGRDGQGHTAAVAAQARSRLGPIDLMLGNHRGFAVYPLQYLFSSVARYLPLVPEPLWTVRQRLMLDEDELIDLAELWGARSLMPYAGGGAPWHWELGLGPVLATGDAHQIEPPPERLARAARQRAGAGAERIASPVQVQLVRPGESLRLHPAGEQILRAPGHTWPYAAAVGA